MSSQIVTTKSNELALPSDELLRYQAMCERLRTLVSNGRKLSDEQVAGLARFATIEKLDPFSGECYMMVDKDGKTLGPVVGIKGYRRKCQDQLGPDNDLLIDFTPIGCPPGVRHAYECRLRDTKTLRAWSAMYKELSGCGMDHKTIVEQIGNAPMTVGVGYFYEAERSDYKDLKYNPIEKAKKRAEAAARRTRFSLPYNFGENGDSGQVVEVSHQINMIDESDSAPVDQVTGEIIDAGPDPEPQSRQAPDEILGQLGFDVPAAPAPAEPTNGKRGLSPKIVQAVIDAGLADSVFSVAGSLRKSCLSATPTQDEVIFWMRLYRAARDDGQHPDQAAETANKEFAK